MFDIFVKNKKIVLDCFTYIPYAYEYAPIDYSEKFIPEWWMSMPRYVHNERFGTMKTLKYCTGFIEYYKNAIVIPSWFELNLTLNERSDQDRYFEWESSNNGINASLNHSIEQFENFCRHDGTNIKLQSCWLFKTKQFVKFDWTEPTWNMRDTLDILNVLPAVIDFKYQHSTNINMFAIRKDYKIKTTIKPLQPLVVVRPLTEKQIEIKNHLISHEEWKTIATGASNLFFNKKNLYSSRKKIIDKADQLKKCPFK